MEDSTYYSDEIPLFGEIDPANSSYKALSTKVELILKKANNVNWPALNPTDKITTWTTFGKGDSPLPEVKKV
ncbi:hypothetical protein AYI70_g12355 [Smittium culicis]|uniref:CS domain-containing protein n=1 Tax=Smittium culicis TaxID=133412 RepID=A0A1R1WXT0_9FUNG|nr:hypothetical protein AYI70_g12355 [Smittium culicis]